MELALSRGGGSLHRMSPHLTHSGLSYRKDDAAREPATTPKTARR
jgi:hypothetical protein